MSLPCLRCFMCRTKVSTNVKQLAHIQSCAILHAKKKFHNPFIHQYNPRINNDYVEDHLMKTHKHALFDLDKGSPDFEQELMKEGHFRRSTYRRSKRMREMLGRRKVELPPLTLEQIQHIKHLHNENPEMWNCSFLAISFNLDPEQVKAVLKNRQNEAKVSKNNDLKSFSKSNDLLPALPIEDLLGMPNSEKNVMHHEKKEFQKNRWFVSFNEPKSESESFIEIENCEDIEDYLQDASLEDEHFEMLEIDDENWIDEESNEDSDNIGINDDYNDNGDNDDNGNDDNDDNDNDDNDNDAFSTSTIDHQENFKVHSSDNCNFYDNEGRFLYRINNK